MMKTKTVAVIGCGKNIEGKVGWAIGHAHAEGYLNCGHPVKLLGVDITPENLEAFGRKFNLPETQLFASTEALYASCTPDCVSICTWPALHYPMVMEALEKGVKAIACEKPFTLDPGEQRALELHVKAKEAVLVVGHQRRLEAPYQTLKAVVQSGVLGDALHARGQVGDGWDLLSWTTHWFDMANYLFDGPPEWVLAGMDIGTTRRYGQAIEDASMVYAQYGGERQATFVTGPGTGTHFMVQGSKGLARIGKQDVECITFEGGLTRTPYDRSARGGFAMLLKELIDAMEGGAEPMCSIGRSAVATEMAYAAHESARTGKKVALPLQIQYAPLEVVQHPIRLGIDGWKILLYADAHFGSGGREGIAEAFSEMTGNPVNVVDAESRGLAPTDLDGVDAVLIYHTQKEVSDETRSTLTDWVASGKPLLIVHAGLGAWPEWKEYTDWCGRVWEWGVSVHPHEPVRINVPERDPLGFGWSEAWLPKDEVFVKLKETAASTVGLTVDISIGTFPAAWKSNALPHVAAWMPGHRRDSWHLPTMREGAARVLRTLRTS